MLRFKFLVSLLAVVGLLVLTATVAQATPITGVTNGTFATPVVADGGWTRFDTGLPTGWLHGNSNGSTVWALQNPAGDTQFVGATDANPPNYGILPGNADNTQCVELGTNLNTDGKEIYQDLGNMGTTPGTTYTFTVAIGCRLDEPLSVWEIFFRTAYNGGSLATLSRPTAGPSIPRGATLLMIPSRTPPRLPTPRVGLAMTFTSS